MKTVVSYGIFIAVLAAFPAFSGARWQEVGTIFLIYSVVALSQDIVLGRAGMFDMGHAIYFGMGAYITAILNSSFNIPVLWTFIPAIILPAIIAIIIAAPIIRLRGDYLLVATIGFNIIFIQVLQNDLFGLTGGPNGIFGIDAPVVFGYELYSMKTTYYMALILLCLTFLLIRNLEKSRAGRALHFLNENEIAAESIGIDTRKYKLFAFALGAAVAGAAGTVFAIHFTVVSPEAFNFMVSVLFFAIVIVGGKSSIPGVLIGTFIMFVLPEMFRQFAEWRYFVFGMAMILTMILRPKGILPVKHGILPKYFKEGA